MEVSVIGVIVPFKITNFKMNKYSIATYDYDSFNKAILSSNSWQNPRFSFLTSRHFGWKQNTRTFCLTGLANKLAKCQFNFVPSGGHVC